MYKFNNIVEPLWVSRVHGGKGMAVKSHSHIYYHLIYIVSGSFDFTIKGKNFVLSDNMMTIARPGDVQSWINTYDTRVETYEIKFSVLDNDLMGALANVPEVLFGNLFIKTLLDKIVDEMKHIRSNYQEYISIYLVTLLYEIVHTNIERQREDPEEIQRLSPSKIVKNYIEDNYKFNLSLDKIALATGFNKSYLATVFKKNEGITINEYLYRYRTYKACELIAYSDLQLATVSEMTGFKHIQHFNRTFKKYIGIPPGEYRNATPQELLRNQGVLKKEFNLEVMPVRSGRVYMVESDSGSHRKMK